MLEDLWAEAVETLLPKVQGGSLDELTEQCIPNVVRTAGHLLYHCLLLLLFLDFTLVNPVLEVLLQLDGASIPHRRLDAFQRVSFDVNSN